MKICFNGNFYPAGAPLLSAQNAGFKWGDGLFETMKVFEGRILLQELHFERLFVSLQLLQIDQSTDLTSQKLAQDILALCAENNCLPSARVRLGVYRNENNKAEYVIEAFALDPDVNRWQEEGLSVCLYPYGRKSTDAFANVKSSSYQLYILAKKFAADKGADDALVLNAANFFCDSSKANLFLLKNGKLYTPALHQGCVNGVMRRIVMQEAKKLGYGLRHDEVSEEQLLAAEEVFLTNAIQIIRWVKQYKNATYRCEHTRKIFDAVRATIFPPSC